MTNINAELVAFVKKVAECDFDGDELQLLAVNIRHVQGAPSLKLKRDAASAALILKAVLADARALAALQEPGHG